MNPILALIIANVIWGAASPIFKYSLENIPPFTLAFIRFFFAAILFLPFMKGFRAGQLTRKDWFEILVGSFFGITINITFFFLGLQRTESINAPIIASAGPVFLFFLSALFLKEKLKRRVFTGMLISLSGVLLIILSPIFLDGKTYVIGEIIGNLFFVVATFGTVFHALFYKKVLEKIDAFKLTFISFLFSSVTFLPFMIWEGQTWSFAQININGIIGIIFGVFLSSAAAYYLYNFGLSKINAQEVGLFAYVDPIVAILIAVPLLGEYPNLYFFIGSILVFSGIFIAEKRIHWHPLHKLKFQSSQPKADRPLDEKIKNIIQ
jgi:drug/metabolite transporter (DMT)-like permease